MRPPWFFLFFFNDTSTTDIYTLSLHDALPIFPLRRQSQPVGIDFENRQFAYLCTSGRLRPRLGRDRKSTRLNSSHTVISYAVFCLKKKKRGPPRPTVRARPPSRARAGSPYAAV